MKHRTSKRFLFLTAILMLASCGRSSQRDFDLVDRVQNTQFLGIGNLTVVEVAPNRQEITLHWEAFDKHDGDAFNVPYEVITLEAGAERYEITDKAVGSNALSVNGNVKTFDSQTHRLRIKFGEGVSIVEGSDYQNATKFYDWKDTQKQR